MEFDSTFWLSAWGAVLSTGLAAIRAWEFFRKGPRLRARRHFTSLPEQGNTITIENISATPAMISYWELVWASGGRPPYVERLRVGSPDTRQDVQTVVVAPHSALTLRFVDEEHFAWGAGTEALGKLYLKLHMADRKKPLWLFVYDPTCPPHLS